MIVWSCVCIQAYECLRVHVYVCVRARIIIYGKNELVVERKETSGLKMCVWLEKKRAPTTHKAGITTDNTPRATASGAYMRLCLCVRT